MTVSTKKERIQKNPRFNWYRSDFDYEVRIDPTLAHNLLCLLESAQGTNGDVVIVIDGEEGSGKSTLARQIGRLLDPTLTERRIEFDPESAKEAHFQGIPSLSSREFVPKLYRAGHYDGKPWQVILLDESAKLDRKRTMASASVDFMGFITQSRQLHKVFIIILPNVHMLDGYIAEHRTVALIHTFKYKKTTMGFYKWYSRRHIKRMFATDMHRQKLYSRDCSFQGRFSSKEPFDITAYEKKKATALEVYRKQDDPNNKEMTREEILVLYEEFAAVKCIKDPKIDQPSVYKALGIDRKRWADIKIRVRKKYALAPEPLKGLLKEHANRKGFMLDLPSSVDDSVDEDVYVEDT